ncbi:arabinogalactan endo-1,4-beta-galactosidase [Caulobacter sp. D4A]|uniref:glycoside hydrolase family 53 protein n=1 Tax=unclassified Caulobacter TaxID=2648921 RepID=UPI000D7364A6|nr:MULTISPECIES: arabinogalactan endo-1,4-beta-galactosidase [unclassified Caulobacter]PXA86798.1 arabinogalactan endo-1,4-beta-galactosidase [Caulobacter sp. D4A]PXA93368.1 arabinogalactan endo-1,4-beta-galactosidase [Caulobacter sp. D5]
MSGLKKLGLGLIAGLLASTSALAAEPLPPKTYLGVDISYANEMDDCGAVYRDGDRKVEQYAYFKQAGANIARIRLWNDPQWTKYSNTEDVVRSIKRAKAAGLQVLLDFHYSDDWADGEKQLAPKAWEKLSTPDQAKALYAFTYDTLRKLDAQGLMPDLVQVGNETNGEIVSTLAKAKDPINWDRNAVLFDAGIKAVRDAGAAGSKKPRVMLHIAQPDTVEYWFAAAAKAGVTDFDMIGISYYSKWSKRSMAQLGATINRLRNTYAADVVVVETSYPFTTEGADSSPNLLGEDSLIPGYPATQEGQKKYLTDLTQLVFANGGTGVFYWEPAWVSTKCKTRWGTGSNWENSTLFDFKGQPTQGMQWLSTPYAFPVETTFKVAAGDKPAAFIDGDFLGGAGPRPMVREGADFVYRTRLMPGSSVTVATAPTAEAVGSAPAVTATIAAKPRALRLPVAP